MISEIENSSFMMRNKISSALSTTLVDDRYAVLLINTFLGMKQERFHVQEES